ncbi:MAG: cytochrome-c peroxidase [Bacteroidetes bacterium]|nr:MAG: cytochrome-c peroxidase [Bacteroidota bacterium]
MKKVILSLALILGFTFLMQAFQAGSKSLKSPMTYAHEKLNRFKESLGALEKTIEAKNEKQVRRAFQVCRDDYKAMEFLLAYLDKGHAALLNAAPIPKVDVSNAQYITLDPSGLQVMEEAVFADSLDFDLLASILRKTQHMASRVSLPESIDEASFYRALYEGVLRVQSMGITGFDVPGSGRAISESEISMKAMLFCLEQLHTEGISLPESLNTAWKKAIGYLNKHRNQERFDRFTFIKDYANPLMSSLSHWYQMRIDEKVAIQIPGNTVNYTATSLFDARLLNASAYSTDPLAPANEARRQLGEYLFFDPILSDGNERACASCHKPELAFSDGRSKSMAWGGKDSLGRNAPGLIYAAFQTAQFWDLREALLEDQMDHVLSNGKEFHSNYAQVIEKLKRSTAYDSLFRKAFSSDKEAIDIRNFNLALAEYVRSLQSFSSPFDQMIRGERKADKEVVQGFNLFMGKALCATCHFAPLFSGLVPPDYTDMESEVIGTLSYPESGKLDKDLGRYYFQSAEVFKGSFKTVSLRNSALTAPYFHHGKYPDLASVVRFYNQGGGSGSGATVPNQTLPFDSLSMNEKEEKNLVKFLESLSDEKRFIAPRSLPSMGDSVLDRRRIGGVYYRGRTGLFN